MTAAALWLAVEGSYDQDSLVGLTNIKDPAGSSIVTAVGEDAAQGVIDLWPSYVQATYDATNATHVEAAKQVVIALLWRRGGSATSVEKVKWEEAVDLMERLRKTGPRGRPTARSNSGVTQKPEAENGRNVQGWSDRGSLPDGLLPQRRLAE